MSDNIGHLFKDIFEELATLNVPVESIRSKIKQLKVAFTATLATSKVNITSHKQRTDEAMFSCL